jgi:branched-chain amino acid transport system substrate-binding protein
MNHRTYISSGLLLLATITPLIAMLVGCNKPIEYQCSDTIGCIAIAPGKSIEIGVLQVLSGGLKASGLMQVRGIELGLVNRNNQLLGHPLKLYVEDSGCSAEMGINAALSLTTKPKLVGIIGPFCSVSATAIIPMVSQAGLVMISGTNSAPSLTSVNGKQGSNWYPGYYRTMYNGIKMAETAAIFTYQELGIKRAATINDGDNFTLELTQEFERIFVKIGGQIGRSAGINKGDQDMGPILKAIAYSKPRLIYFPLFEPDAVNIIKQAKKIHGLENVKLIGSDGARSEKFLETIGSAGIGLYLTAPQPVENKAYAKLLSDYEARHQEKPYHFSLPHVYDAAGLLLQAIETIAVKEPDGTLHIGRQALRNALYKTSDYEGITGRLTCDSFGDFYAGTYTMIQLDNLAAGMEGFNANIKYRYR